MDWTVDELKEADRKTRMLLTLNGALHPRSNTDRLYLLRVEGVTGLISFEECIRQEEHCRRHFFVELFHKDFFTSDG